MLIPKQVRNDRKGKMRQSREGRIGYELWIWLSNAGAQIKYAPLTAKVPEQKKLTIPIREDNQKKEF